MSIRRDCPCDLDGVCPYESGEYCSCEYWCGADEPQDDPEDWEEYSGYSYPQDNPPAPIGPVAVWDEDDDESRVDDCPEAEPNFWMSSTESPDTYLSTSGEVRHFRSRLSQEESATS